MEIQELREELITYIQVADEKQLEALGTLLLDKGKLEGKWWEDEGFMAELEEDTRKIESGEEDTYSIAEVQGFLQEQKVERYSTHV